MEQVPTKHNGTQHVLRTTSGIPEFAGCPGKTHESWWVGQLEVWIQRGTPTHIAILKAQEEGRTVAVTVTLTELELELESPAATSDK